jgi:hypothetical protein
MARKSVRASIAGSIRTVADFGVGILINLKGRVLLCDQEETSLDRIRGSAPRRARRARIR